MVQVIYDVRMRSCIIICCTQVLNIQWGNDWFQVRVEQPFFCSLSHVNKFCAICPQEPNKSRIHHLLKLLWVFSQQLWKTPHLLIHVNRLREVSPFCKTPSPGYFQRGNRRKFNIDYRMNIKCLYYSMVVVFLAILICIYITFHF